MSANIYQDKSELLLETFVSSAEVTRSLVGTCFVRFAAGLPFAGCLPLQLIRADLPLPTMAVSATQPASAISYTQQLAFTIHGRVGHTTGLSYIIHTATCL